MTDPHVAGEQVTALVAHDEVRFAVEDAIAIITIDRPGRRNSLSARTARAIADFADRAERDPAIGAIVITGTGDRAFCAGMDLKEAAEIDIANIGHGHIMFPDTGLAGLTEREFTKPLIAAVNGPAAGGGSEIAFSCDIIVAAHHATFCLPEVKHGLFAFGGGIQQLAYLLPRSEALTMLLTGLPLPAQRLYDLGVVSRLTATGETLAAAKTLAKSINSNSWEAVRRTKHLHRISSELPIRRALQIGETIGFASFAHPDAAEGVSAFGRGKSAS